MENHYKIIGGDGREYGPVTGEELVGWIRDGRVSAATQVWNDQRGAWMPASAYVEFVQALADQAATLGTAPSVANTTPTGNGQGIQASVETEKPTGFWARLAAYIIDSIILAVLFSVIWPGISALTGWTIPTMPMAEGTVDPAAYLRSLIEYFDKVMPVLIPYLITTKIIQFAYEVACNGSWGATPGKMAIGARIVRLDGSSIGYKVAILRWLAARISDFLFCVGYLFIAVRSDKRALHDLLAGTKVIYKR